ncbi:Y-family DNA polymerase [Balneola sp. MJW-20]|uniref:Y-family DNA polymerase n=1 Tax=Gracilimonas aurantiaca TaxID=3234185 RepID=UPI00346592A1
MMNIPDSFESRGSIAYAMIDCNNFYASCERAFDPSLKNKPIVILSNNDGCVIARSNEAKEIGIPMGAPEFKYREEFKKHKVAVLSSNYALYGDMSRRVMDVLREMTHDIEVYSIDEAFAELSTNTFADLEQYGKKIRERVLRYTGIPVSVGIAESKTLAKIANERAKKNPEYHGVLNLVGHDRTDELLSAIPLNDIWGIGNGMTLRLNRYHIETALDLKQTIRNKRWVRKHLNVTGLRTVLELNGIPCMKLEQTLNAKKGILSSRMFGKPMYKVQPVQEAVCSYAARAAEKLRAQKSVCTNLQVTLVTDKYENPGNKYKYTGFITFSNPTAHSPHIISAAADLTSSLFRNGNKYKKASVMLTGLHPDQEVQMDLFNESGYDDQQRALMSCIDQLNSKHGRNTANFAATGLHRQTGDERVWKMKQNYLSPRYTTRWDEIMTAKTG